MPEPAKSPYRVPVLSPCVGICRLDSAHVCTGCNRTLDEIVRWGQMTDKERKIVMERVALSKA